MDQRLIENLGLASKLENEDDFRVFSGVLEEMVLSKNPAYIPHMLAFLNDESLFIEAMDNIVSSAESFPDKEYIKVVLDMTPNLEKNSNFWLNAIYSRLFNSPSCLKVYKEEYDKLSNDKKINIKNYLDNIFVENKKFE